MKKKQRRGFALLSPARRAEVASLGGKAISSGHKGRNHMARIGRVGGYNSHHTATGLDANGNGTTIQ